MHLIIQSLKYNLAQGVIFCHLRTYLLRVGRAIKTKNRERKNDRERIERVRERRREKERCIRGQAGVFIKVDHRQHGSS